MVRFSKLGSLLSLLTDLVSLTQRFFCVPRHDGKRAPLYFQQHDCKYKKKRSVACELRKMEPKEA
uniref:Uncharacterized protein n=1 Tax=Rhodnius prolixus TaxID=13249 RepID=T1I3N3_RHOPR